MEKLIFERSSPVQGEPVNVYVHGKKGKVGQLIVTYEEWLHFNKLIREGQESLKRKNEQRIEIVIQGLHEGVPIKLNSEIETKVRVIPRVVLESEVQEILAGVEVEVDKEDEEAVEQAEGEQKLVRSLLKEEEKDGSK